MHIRPPPPQVRLGLVHDGLSTARPGTWELHAKATEPLRGPAQSVNRTELMALADFAEATGGHRRFTADSAYVKRGVQAPSGAAATDAPLAMGSGSASPGPGGHPRGPHSRQMPQQLQLLGISTVQRDISLLCHEKRQQHSQSNRRGGKHGAHPFCSCCSICIYSACLGRFLFPPTFAFTLF